DLVEETALMLGYLNGDPKMMERVLKGRRGGRYNDRQEITGKGGAPIEFTINLGGVPRPQRREGSARRGWTCQPSTRAHRASGWFTPALPMWCCTAGLLAAASPKPCCGRPSSNAWRLPATRLCFCAARSRS